MIYEKFTKSILMYVTQKYSPNAKKLNNVPDAKNNDATNPTDNSLGNDLDSLLYVI